MRTNILTRRPKAPKERKERVRVEGVRAALLRVLDIGGAAAPAIGPYVGHPVPSTGGLVRQMEVSTLVLFSGILTLLTFSP